MEQASLEQNKKPLDSLSNLKRSMSITGIKIPMRQCSTYQIRLAPYLLNKPYSSNIVQDDQKTLDKRVLLLGESVNKDLEGLPQDLKTWIVNEQEAGVEVVTHNLDIDYKSYNLEQLLKLLLPSQVNTTLKIDNLGEIKILDLTEEQMKYKDTIGQLMLEKSPLSQIVLLKLRHQKNDNLVEKYFSETKYELLCGEPKTEIELAEAPCTFKVDLLKVFYDSAFQEERERLLTLISKDEIICDVFGDLFLSIRAAKSNSSQVISNCNNTDVYNAYEANIKLNGVESLIELQNKDLGSFLEGCLTRSFEKEGVTSHVNHIYFSRFLEDVSFLKIFVGLFNKINNKAYKDAEKLPHVHFYLYVQNEDFTDSMRKVIANKINQVFNDSFTNKEIRDIFAADDFESIFIVEDDQTNRKLLQCTLKLSEKIAYCAENLVEHIVQITSSSVEPAKEPEKIAIEEVPQTNGQPKEGTTEEVKGDMNEEIEDKPKEEVVQNDAMNEEVTEPVKETSKEKPKGDAGEEVKENVAEEETKDNKKVSKSKSSASAKKSTTRKPKKEVVHQSPKPVTELEKEEGAGDLRRSSRKKTRSKQFDDFEYTAAGSNRESSK